MSREFFQWFACNRWFASAAVLSLIFSFVTFFDSPEKSEASVSRTNLALEYDFSNSRTYSGSGSTFNDLSGAGRTGTLFGNASISAGAFNSVAGSNGTSYAAISGSFNGLSNGVTISFEGNLGSINTWERVISLGDTAPRVRGLWDDGDGIWMGRFGDTNDLIIDSFVNGASSSCRSPNALLDESNARWVISISPTGVCRMFKNGSELLTNLNGGANNSSGTQMNPGLTSAVLNQNFIGRSQWIADTDFGGSIRWLKVYTTALSPAEVSDEYTGTVQFNANGGTGSMSTQSSTQMATLSNNAFNRNGYTFTGWNTVATGGGSSWSNGGTYSFSDDITLYAQWSLNSPSVSLSGTARQGQVLTASPTAAAAGVTSKLTWQRSSNNSTWTNISGATASTYTLTQYDVGQYIRVSQSLTDGTQSTSAVSSATTQVLSTNSVTGASGATTNVGSMFSVPAGSTVYNVTLTSSNLNGLFSLGTTTGLTWVEGYSTTSSYMPTSISGTGSIFTFRGTGDAINTALASLRYQSSSVQTDSLKMHYAVGNASNAYDIRNYIPIFDNGTLKFHYYSYQLPWPTSYTRAQYATQLSTLFTASLPTAPSTSITSPNAWYLATSRYQVENTRLSQLTVDCSAGCWATAGGLANAGSSQWYWEANADGFANATNVSFTNWAAGNPNESTAGGRIQLYIASAGSAQWDDKQITESVGAALIETYSATPLSATTSTQTFRTVSAAASAPSNVTATATSKTSALITWNAATSNLDSGISSYRVDYSTSNTFSSFTSATTSSGSNLSAVLTGLLAGTQYHVRVVPLVESVSGTASSTVTVTPSASSARTVTIVNSGGAAQGSGWTIANNVLVATSNVSINASDVNTALSSGNLTISADTVTVSSAVAWSPSSRLTLGSDSTSTVAINADITATGASAGLVMAGSSYSLDTKTGANIVLSGASATLRIGVNDYTLIDDVSDFASVNAGWWYALARPLTFTTSSTTSPINLTFTGRFDGLGNTVNNMTLRPTVTGSYGLFRGLAGATILNLGVTNVNILSSSSALNLRIGALAGNGAAEGVVTTTLTNVWTTGFITQSSSTGGALELGGIIGGATTNQATLSISRSWSSVAIRSSSTGTPGEGLGGIIGSSVSGHGKWDLTGANLSIDQVYSTGSVSSFSAGGWFGAGGIVGATSVDSLSITNSFSWGTISGPYSLGGIAGAVSSRILTGSNLYSTQNNLGVTCSGTCQTGVVPGSQVTGLNSGFWSTTNGASLVNLAAPTRELYVEVTFSNSTGSVRDLGYQIVDSSGTVQSTSNLTSLGLSVSGTPSYSINSSSARGTYSVNYDTGLTLGGSSAGVYSLANWSSATSVTITRLIPTLSWSPTTALIRTDTGSTVSAATTSGDGAISYAVTSQGTTGCAINSATRVLTFTAEGSCTVTATSAQTTQFVSQTTSATFVITTAPPLAPGSLTVSGGVADGRLDVSWSAPSTTATGGTISSYTLEYSSDNTTWTSVTGLTTTSTTITGLTNGTSYSVRVKAVNSTGQESTWASTDSIPFWVASNTVAPALSGSAVAALTITGSQGTWNFNGGNINVLSYQWQFSDNGSNNWQNIPSATSGSYVVASTYVGKYLRLAVSATNGANNNQAVTAYSPVSSQVLSGLASAPQSVSSGRSNASIDVSWSAPAALNGGTISAYKVQYSTDNSSWTTATSSLSSSATSYTITGLTNGTAYYTRVLAVTAAGESPAGANSGTITPSTLASNTAIPSISGTVAAGRTLTATTGTWNSGGAALTYTYQWQSASSSQGSFSNIAGATGSTYVLSTDQVGKYLKVVVTATNENGAVSQASEETAVVDSGVTNAPGSVAATFSSTPSLKVTVSWDAPTALNGASAITGYTVSYSTSLNGTYNIASSSVPAGDTSLDVTGLTPGTTYYFKVTAQTAAGSSPAGTSSSVLYGGAPSVSSAPVLSGNEGVGETLSVSTGSWTDYGVAISGYTYQWQKSLSLLSGWSDISGATSSTFTPTQSESGYYLRVVVGATNSAGTTTTTVDSGVIGTGVASAPQSVTVTEGDEELTVSWSAPSSTRGGVIRNYAVATRVDNGTWTTLTSTLGANATSYTITGLDNGVSVDVRVWAITTLTGDIATVTGKSPFGTPIVDTQPSLSGSSGVGEVITLTPGSAEANGRAIGQTTYQWQVSTNNGSTWSDVDQETSTSFTVPSGATGNLYRAQVSYTNDAGTTVATSSPTAAIESGIADAPTGLTVERGNAQLTVTWSAPVNTNSGTITGYVVRYREGASGTWTTASSSVSAGATSYVITGLTNGTGYTVQINAVTAAGAGTTAETVNLTTPSTTPSNSVIPSLTGTAAVARTLNAVNGTWSTGGATVTYTYQWQTSQTSNGTFTDVAGATSSSFTPVTEQSGLFIRVLVTVTNVAGATTVASVGTTQIQSGLAGAPTISSPQSGNSQITVSWGAPSVLNGGTISAYNVYYQVNGESTWTQVQRSSPNSMNETITGLTNGTSYKIKVEAVTAAGVGVSAVQNASALTTPFTTPINTSLPTLNSVAAVGEVISMASAGAWTTFGQSTTYTYQWQRSSDGVSSWTDISGATASSFSISDPNDVGRYFRIKVVADNGAPVDGVAFSAASAVIQTGISSAPQSLVVTRNDQSLDVTWQAPATLNGGTITAYKIERSTNGTSWTTFSSTISEGDTSARITGLANGTGYFVRISALTNAGESPFATSPTKTTPSTVPSSTINTYVRLGGLVSGGVAAGVPLAAETGNWNNGGAEITHYSYQWSQSNRCDSIFQPISGATEATYTPTSQIVNKFIRLTVTAHNVAGSTSKNSECYGPINSGLANAPTNVSGVFEDVSGLRIQVSWTAPSALNGAPSVASYQVSYATSPTGTYTVASDSISGSATTYNVTGLSAGETYYFKVAAITGAGTGTLSTATSGVLFGAAPLNTVAPAISGSSGNGETLSVSDGTWNTYGVALSSVTYQWQRSANGTSGWTDIAGETYDSYTLTDADVGSYVRVAVDASNSLGTTTVTTSSSLIGSAVASAPQNLTVTEGNQRLDLSWSAPASLNGGVLRNYQVEINSGSGWSVLTNTLSSSTTTYSITGLTNGTSYTVRVLAITTRDGSAATSSGNQIPFGAPINSVVPETSGALAEGETLSAADGTWNTNGKLITGTTYQWLVSTDDGQTFSAVAGATSGTYQLPSGSTGNLYKVEVTKINAGGSTTAVSSATTAVDTGVASAPSAPVLVRGDQSLSVSWSAPSDLNGGILRDYVVEYRESGSSGIWTRVTRTASTTASENISGLTNGTSYDVRISAVTTVEGDVSTVSSAIPAALPLVTSVPTFTGELADGYTLTATSGQYDINSSGSLSYALRWEVSADGSTWSALGGATSTTLELTSAEVGKYIRLVETATNNVGSTEAQSVSSPVTVGSGIPDAPSTLSVSAGQDGQLDVTWSQVTGAGLNGSISDGYLVEYSADGTNWTALPQTGSLTTTQSISGLVNGTTYTVRVATVNTEGVQGSSLVSTATTAYYRPINLTVPEISGVTARGYTLSADTGSWSENGSAVSSTTYQWQSSSDQGQSWTNIGSATSSTYSVTSSDIGKLLRVKITAENAAGQTIAYSLPTSAITSAIAAAPTNITVTVLDGQLQVNWVAPTQLSGGVISDYRVRISTDNSTWTTVSASASTQASRLIGSLTNGTPYWIAVAAVTSVVGNEASTVSSYVPYGAPLSSSAPSVSGTLQIGETLTASSGTWTNNGRSITSTTYQWQVSNDGQTNWTNISGATQSTYTPLSELGQYLRVVVTASNEAASSTSVSSPATTALAIGVPDAPNWLTLSPVDQGIAVSWQAPSWLAGGTLADYTVEYRASGQWLPVSRAASTATTFTITGLSIGTAYEVRVRAETGMSSAWATSGSFTVVGQPTIQTAPVVSGTPLAGSSLSVSDGTWNANGSSLTSIAYQWQESTDGGQSFSNVAGATQPTVTAVAGRIYRAQVTATNSAGSVVTSSSQSLYVVSTRPSVPTGVSVTPGDQSLVVSWNAPTNVGGGTISDYIVEYSVASDNPTTWVRVTRSASATTSQTITGLTNGVDYDVRVFAQTSVVGQSAGYAPTAVHPFGAPIWDGPAQNVTGTVRFGATLNTGAGTWDWNGTTSSGVSYQWQHSSDSGNTWTDIPAATSASYQIDGYVSGILRVALTATNSAGQQTTAYSSATTVVSPANPSVPQSLTAVAQDSQIQVNWSTPSNLGGAPLSAYEVQHSVDGTNWTTVSRSNVLATQQTITGLTNGVDYEVRVRAVTQSHVTAYGSWSRVSTITPYGLPQALTSPALSGTERYDSTLFATPGLWDDNGRNITVGYQWQYLSGSTWMDIPGATSSSYLVGEYVGSSLRVTVTATNEAGATQSSSLPSAAIVAAAPSEISGLSIVPGDSSVVLNWSVPSYVGGSPITNYVVEYATENGSWTTVTRTASAVTSQTITGLDNGTSYQVRIRAFNGVSGSPVTSPLFVPRSNPINSVVPVISFHPNSPTQPQIGRSMSVDAGSWNSNGSAITSYTYQWQSNNGSGWENIAGATTQSFTPQSVVGSTLRVMVTAINSAGGTSAFSLTTSQTIPAASSAPRNLTVTEQDQAFVLSWTIPSSTGGAPVIDYEVETSVDGNTWVPQSRSPSALTTHTVGGVTNGVEYSVRVRALNGVNGSWAYLSAPAVPRGIPQNTVVPAIAGTPQFGAVLSASQGTWDTNGAEVESVTYSWQHSRDGQTWADIPRATAANYTVGLYVGSQLRVMVSAVNEAGSQSVPSVATSTISAIPAATPVITSQSVGNAQITLGWTPPAHSGGNDLTGYTLEYSTDQTTWIAQSFGSSVTSATLTGLTNSASYFARIRAETDRAGDWSPIAGPFVPTAPATVVIAQRTAPSPTSTTPQVMDLVSMLRTQVMPMSPVIPSMTSLTGEPEIQVSEDGRIALNPQQSIALRNGEPVDAQAVLTNNGLTMTVENVNVNINFESSGQPTDSPTLFEQSSFDVEASGYLIGTPVVVWIQSDPIKLGEFSTDSSGKILGNATLPAAISAGYHTLQVNGLSENGDVISIIYGVEVLSSAIFENTAQDQDTIQVWPIGLAFAVIVVATAVIVARSRRRVTHS